MHLPPGDEIVQYARQDQEIHHRSRSPGAAPFVTGYLAYAYGKADDRARAMATLGELERMSPEAE